MSEEALKESEMKSKVFFHERRVEKEQSGYFTSQHRTDELERMERYSVLFFVVATGFV